MIESLEKVFDAERGVGEFTKKRNIMRLLSELYLKGLFNDYRKVFRCLNYMMMIPMTPQQMKDFKNGLIVITDYLKTYGEIFFHILSRQRREAIEMDQEVTIQRYEFLNANQREKIYQYFKKHLTDKCLVELNAKFKDLKQLQAKHEDNIKEVKEDERIEREYMAATQEFERMLSIVEDFADVIDDNKIAGKYILQEDKSLQTKMIIKKKQAGGGDNTDEYYPFDDELQYRFYKELPDLSRFIITQN